MVVIKHTLKSGKAGIELQWVPTRNNETPKITFDSSRQKISFDWTYELDGKEIKQKTQHFYQIIIPKGCEPNMVENIQGFFPGANTYNPYGYGEKFLYLILGLCNDDPRRKTAGVLGSIPTLIIKDNGAITLSKKSPRELDESVKTASPKILLAFAGAYVHAVQKAINEQFPDAKKTYGGFSTGANAGFKPENQQHLTSGDIIHCSGLSLSNEHWFASMKQWIGEIPEGVTVVITTGEKDSFSSKENLEAVRAEAGDGVKVVFYFVEGDHNLKHLSGSEWAKLMYENYHKNYRENKKAA